MLLKFLLGLWPAFIPIIIYLFWRFFVEKLLSSKIFKRRNTIETKRVGEELVGKKSTKYQPKEEIFSLNNDCFLLALYSSFIIAIITLIFAALS